MISPFDDETVKTEPKTAQAWFVIIFQASRLVFHHASHRLKNLHLYPAAYLLNLIHRYNSSSHRLQHCCPSSSATMQPPHYRLVPLPKQLYAILTANEYLHCDHYAFLSAAMYNDYVKSKEANWLNLTFIDAPNSTVSSTVAHQPHQPAIVTAMLKKPTQSVLVPVLQAPATCEPNTVFISENCFQNFVIKYKLAETVATPVHVQLQLFQAAQQIPQLANKATVFIINQPHELTNDLIDEILGAYFANPQILYRNHTYEIPLTERTLGNAIYARNFHTFAGLGRLYIRCVHLETKDNAFELAAVVVKNLTSLQQTTSINMAVPRQQLHDICPGVRTFPSGLTKHFDMLKSSMLPFVAVATAAENSSSSLSSMPLFLLQGDRGAGKTTVLMAVAQDLGCQVYGVDCVDIVSQIPSQTEAKLTNVLNKANLCEPLIIALYNFEVKILNFKRCICKQNNRFFFVLTTDFWA